MFAFHTYVQDTFVNYAICLKWTKSRILIKSTRMCTMVKVPLSTFVNPPIYTILVLWYIGGGAPYLLEGDQIKSRLLEGGISPLYEGDVNNISLARAADLGRCF